MNTFRRLLVVFMCGVLASILAIAQSIIGDVNEDGEVNLTDVIMTISYISGNQFEGFAEANADINGDGRINLTDVTSLVNRILQKNQKIEEDVLYVRYNGKTVDIINPDASTYQVNVSNADVEVRIVGETPNHTISIDGESADGRLRVVADTVYNLRLNGVNLTSSHAPAINSCSKQKMNVEIVDRTKNYLKDAKKYIFEDTEETANACFCSQGNITFTGNGNLYVEGNQKHGICSGKGMKLNQGKIYVTSAPSDAIHSGKYIYLEGAKLTLDGQKQDGMDADEEIKITKGSANITVSGKDAKAMKCGGDFTMKDGLVEMTLLANMSKGVKAKGDISISGGSINATATGNVVIENGSPTYCTIIKGDADALISGGEFNLVSNGAGGKGISVDHNLRITGGRFHLECNGDGAEYVNTDNEADYYTPKCLAADDSLFVERGDITCISIGLGGKGIVAGQYMSIGLPTDTDYSQGPTIDVETLGTCIIDNVDEDLRFGCPKGIKVNDILHIYSGDIKVHTEGMGGEGVECNNEFYFHNGMLECNCYDDGINVGNKIDIENGFVYCNSIDNDGIDSNGKITILGGVVVALTQSLQNESFDTENFSLYILGGTVFGIGGQRVHLQECSNPCYNTLYIFSEDGTVTSGIGVEKGKYVYILKDDVAIMALQSSFDKDNVYITLTDKDMVENEEYKICQGDKPLSPGESFFDGKFVTGGMPVNETEILKFIAR